MSDEQKKAGSRKGRREFVGMSVAGLAASLAACNQQPAVQNPVAKADKFNALLTLEGGLFRLNASNGNVEVAYPRKMGDDSSCAFTEHPMYLEVGAATYSVEGTELEKDWPWDLSGYTVTFAVGGSTNKPDAGQWKPAPASPYPSMGSAEEMAHLDWIPTVDAKPHDDWEARAAVRLVFPTGQWTTLRTKDPEVRNELWSLKDGTVEVRKQYVTDQAGWEDRSDGPLVLTFTKGGAKKGAITFQPKKPGGVVQLFISTPPVGGELKAGDPVEHYCMYYSLLKDVARKFTPYRTGEKFSTKALIDKDPVPGRFCPGAKIIG